MPATPDPRQLIAGQWPSLDLTTMEEALLVHLVRHQGQILRRSDLLRDVWGVRETTKTNVVPTTVARLRRKIEPDMASPVFLMTIRGRGYRLELPGHEEPQAPPLVPRDAPSPPEGVGLTPLVGRSADLAQVQRRLDEGARLIALVGPPGIGKTRLAWEFAHGATRARFCSLASCRSAEDMHREIASSLGILQRPDVEVATQIIDVLLHLGTGLLILDCFEHLPKVAALEVQDLVRRAPGWVVLVTSRARLAVTDEVAVPLGALASGDAEALLQILLHDDPPDRSLIVDLAALLGGVPLAIELAAARAQSLPLWLLRRRLTEGLAILDEGVAASSRSLMGATRWSWNLLTQEEKQALVQLCALEGSGRIDMVESILQVDVDPLSVLGSLLDKSMLARDPQDRRRLLVSQTVRDFVCETEPEALEIGRARVASWACALAQRLGDDFGVRPEAYWRMLAEKHNLIGAHRWLLRRRDSRAIPLVAYLGILDRMGAMGGQLELLRQTRLTLSPTGVQAVRLHLAFAKALRARPVRGRAEIDRGLAMVMPDDLRVEFLDHLASLEVASGDGPKAVETAEKALHLCRASGLHLLESRVLNRLAAACYEAGDLDRSMEVLQDALARYPRVQDAAVLWHNLAELHALREEAEDYARCHGLGRSVAEYFGDKGALHMLDNAHTLHLARIGEYTQAHLLREELLEQASRYGHNNITVGAEMINAGMLALLAGVTDVAIARLSVGKKQLEALGHEGSRMQACLAYLLMAHAHAGDLARCEQLAESLTADLRSVDGARAHLDVLRGDGPSLKAARDMLGTLRGGGERAWVPVVLLERLLAPGAS